MNARAWLLEMRKRRTRYEPADLAHGLGVPTSQVQAWMAQGLLTYSIGKRGYPLIRKAAIKRLLANPQVAAAIQRASGRRAGQR